MFPIVYKASLEEGLGLEKGDMARSEFVLKVQPIGFAGEQKVGVRTKEESRVSLLVLTEKLEEWTHTLS